MNLRRKDEVILSFILVSFVAQSHRAKILTIGRKTFFEAQRSLGDVERHEQSAI